MAHLAEEVRFGCPRATISQPAAPGVSAYAVIMRTVVYVDAFNLYYRALKGTAYKWLDLWALSLLLLTPPGYNIQRVRYFTAHVTPRANDVRAAQRQQAYIRALKATKVNVHLGTYMAKTKTRPLANKTPLKFVEILDTEEKGSDVNLASYLLRDGYRDEYEAALVISNDSDLKLPIRMVQKELGKSVVVAITDPKAPRSALPATSYRRVRSGVLARSQLPDPVREGQGSVYKPSGW